MLEQLLKENKITSQQVLVYQLFALNKTGRKWIKQCKDELFKVTPTNFDSLGTLAAISGRMAIFREIDYTIETIENLLKGDNNE